jgi:tetraacyldisaccharide 4'-kinase
MNFNHPVIKAIRFLLLPVSGIYALILKIRHTFFNKNIFHSVTFDRPVICVGNISAGGTGKTPMVEWLVRHLQNYYRLAIVSRGYGRKTKGFLLADQQTTAETIGDEPRQILNKFPDLVFAVGEERVPAISRLIEEKPQTEVIILDDAYQHRWVKAAVNIVLTTYDDLYTDDFLLPTGNLRDLPSAANRAQAIVVTKCPSSLTLLQKQKIQKKLKVKPGQALYFSTIEYREPIHMKTRSKLRIEDYREVLLVTGIANPALMEHYLKQYPVKLSTKTYPDHYAFEQKDIDQLHTLYQSLGENVLMLTTEKDAVRLEKFTVNMNWAVLPIQTKFLDEALPFEEWLLQQIDQVNSKYN